jgi:hypothetical protein
MSFGCACPDEPQAELGVALFRVLFTTQLFISRSDNSDAAAQRW